MSDVRTPVALVKAGVARDPDSTLLTFVEVAADGGFLEETRSYRNLLDNGTALAAALAGEGMAAGDSFALLMPNHPEFVDAMIGSELASTIFVPIDPRTRGDRLAYMLRFTHCRGVIVSPSSLAALVEIADLADRAHRGDAQARARVGLITPLAKAWGTDVGCEVASLGVQVHGGMGFVEETGAAQHYRDARISPIYEGSNGIQAIDLVLRKLRGDSGAAFRPLLDEIEVMAQSGSLLAELAGAVRETGEWMMADGDINARLMAAYPFLTMFSVLVAGWLFEQQLSLIDQDHQGRSWSSQFISGKKAAAKFFTACIVPEAVGLRSSVLSGVSLCELEGL
jgi:hypothetical protein